MIYANIYAEGRTNNSLFDVVDSQHKFNPTYFPRLLRESFLDAGVEINTADLNVDKKISFDFYMEGQKIIENSHPRFLLTLENPFINPLNQDKIYCNNFSKVFAWDARLFNLPNIHPILIPHALKIEDFTEFSKRKIFSCLINANKAFKHVLPSDLYQERIKTIRWYESNALDKFELFGLGWDKSTPAFNFKDKLKRIFPMIKAKFFGMKPYPSFVGEVRDKSQVLRFAKFSYCYENSRDLENYVTEKIFDSLVCGCVPVYWGSHNISELIPSECFIDRRHFVDTAAVHTYLTSITEDQYCQYQKNIMEFLNGENAKKFHAKYIATNIVENILKEQKLFN